MSTANLSEYCKALYSFADLESKLNNSSPDNQLIDKIKLLSAGIFRIVVMGEIKKGKSSFINAMLGVENLVPVSTDVATSTIYKICYGEQLAYKVFFTEKSGKGTQVISQDELYSFGTEAGNPGNVKEVDFIQVFVPSSILKGGLVIIDTPGLGGLCKEHKRITYEYAPRADAVFLVTDSVESPIGKDELDLLNDLKKITSQVYFVQTKSVVVDRNARIARKQNNLTILKNAGFGDVNLQYFLVDSKLKHEADKYHDFQDLNDSGYPLIMSLIEQQIKPNVHNHLIKKMQLELRPRFDEVARKIELRKQIIASDTADKRKELQKKIEAADQELQDWEKTKMPNMLDDFQKSLVSIRHTAETKLNECRPGGVINQQLDELLNKAKSTADLQGRVNALIAKQMPAMMTEYYVQIMQKLQADVEDMLSRFSLSQRYEITRPMMQNGTGGNVSYNQLSDTVEKIANSGTLFESLRTGLYGGIAGGTIASTVGGIIGSVIPVVGTVIGSAAGIAIAGFWGLYEARKIKDKQELEKGVQQMRIAVSQTLSNFYVETLNDIKHMLEQVTNAMRTALRKNIASQRDSLAAHKQELEKQERSNISELEQQRKEVDDLSKQFIAILNVIR